MFQDIQRVFRESMAAFRSELGRSEPEDQVAALLTSMKREMVAARADLPLHREAVERAQREVQRERAELDACERRKGMAERIGDSETARVAVEFAARHRERLLVLEQKAQAAEAELALRTREIDEMKARFQEADKNRFALLAQLRTANARQRMRSVLGDEAGAFDDLSDSPPPPPPPDVDEQLRELKRRMGKD